MQIINLYGGPGSGKSTLAAHLFTKLKIGGWRAELVGEAAKELIYQGSTRQLQNQLGMFMRQYLKLVDLQESGCQVAVADSPLFYNILFSPGGKKYIYWNTMLQACNIAETEEFSNYRDIYVVRPNEYDTFGRVHDAGESAQMDTRIRQHFLEHNRKFNLEVMANAQGYKQATEFVLEYVGAGNFTKEKLEAY
jgi:hypothetical protein